MDNTNVNSGIKGGLQAYLEDSFPMLLWIGCTNQKSALCFKHVLPNYQNVSNANIFLLNLWKYFKYQTLAMNLLQECSKIYGNISSVVPVCPSTTRWTAHDRACMVVIKNLQATLQALSTCYNERKEAEALGLFIQAVSPYNISTILMLLEVLSAITPLTLCLQKSQNKICLADIPNHLETSSLKLNDVRTMTETRKFLTEQNFRELVQIAEEQTSSLPTTNRLRAEKFDFTEFSEELLPKFIGDFQAELNEAFVQIQFWKSFSVFDLQNLPRKLSELQTYRIKEMETLINHYGSVQKSSKFGQVHYQGPDISADESMAEFAGFKYLIYTKCKEQQQFPDQIFNFHRLWLLLSKHDVHKEIYPNCFKLFKLLMIFPLSATCVERLFSKMKIVKNGLRNSLLNATLESLLLITTESPKAGFEDDVLEQFVDELKIRNLNMRLKI